MKEFGVCPKLLQTDCGTRNVLIVPIQSRLQVSVHAHRYPSSVADIRIQKWWSHNRKGYTGWLINFFNPIQDGLFRGCSWMGRGAKSLPPPRPPLKICHTYPTMMKLGTVISYPKKIQKLYESRDTPIGFC